ncbi:MAG: hypothetical protein R3A79_04595 [Nannocystaceae bacterium]
MARSSKRSTRRAPAARLAIVGVAATALALAFAGTPAAAAARAAGASASAGDEPRGDGDATADATGGELHVGADAAADAPAGSELGVDADAAASATAGDPQGVGGEAGAAAPGDPADEARAAAATVRGYLGPVAVSHGDGGDAPATGEKKAKKRKKKAKKKKKKAKKKKKKAKRKVNLGADYHVGISAGVYAQDPAGGVAAAAGIRQGIEPKKNHRMYFTLDYEYEPFSTKTLGFPEEDEALAGIQRSIVEPLHALAVGAQRKIKWKSWLRSELRLHGDAWFPSVVAHRRWSMRAAPSLRIGKLKGTYAELGGELFYKKYPDYLVATRRIDQEGVEGGVLVGHKLGEVARLRGGFAATFTNYLDARYNTLAANGVFLRAEESKNYISLTPWADVRVTPGRGLTLAARYVYQRHLTQHYDRVMTGRDEFASLQPKFFAGYYDYRRHRFRLAGGGSLGDRLELRLYAEAWVRRFDVYEARDVDNYWTGELRLDTELELGGDASVRLYTPPRAKLAPSLYLTLFGSHIHRRSNMERQVSLATNFDVTRVFLGVELRGSSRLRSGR